MKGNIRASAGSVLFAGALCGLAATAASASEEATVLSKESSVTAGETARFQFDGTVRFADGFSVRGGHAEFLFTSGSALAKKGSPPAGANGLTRASLKGALMSLDYSLPKAGSVSAEAFGANGRSLGKWVWNEASAGPHSRQLELRSAPRSGKVFVQWKSGEVRMVRGISPR